MAAGVVDDLELIEVHVQQCVIGAGALSIVDGVLQTTLEFTPIRKARQGVVRRLMMKLCRKLRAPV
jgi:hypothetical protein